MNLHAHVSCPGVLTRTHFCPFRRAQFMHYVMEQSQCRNGAALPRKMSLMWWKCIKLTGRAEANASIAAGHDAALSTSVSKQPGSFYWVLSLVFKKGTAPVAKRLSLKANKDIFFFFFSFFFMRADISGLLDTLVIKGTPLKTESENRSIMWAADKGNVTVVRKTLANNLVTSFKL